MFDKLLIFLLIVSFPVAAYLTHQYILKDEEVKNEETIAKVDAVLGQLQKSIGNKDRNAAEKEPEITVNAVFHATSAGVLSVAGIAPARNVQLLLSIIPQRKNASKVEASEAAVLGKEVEVRALSVGGDGIFTFEYPVEDDELEKVELRLDQAGASTTIIYNFETKKYEVF